MAYRIQLTPAAARALKKLPVTVQKRIRTAIDRLREQPRPSGIKKLKGTSGLYRMRVGEYRILYEVRDEILVVIVVRIATRQQVYRQL